MSKVSNQLTNKFVFAGQTYFLYTNSNKKLVIWPDNYYKLKKYSKDNIGVKQTQIIQLTRGQLIDISLRDKMLIKIIQKKHPWNKLKTISFEKFLKVKKEYEQKHKISK